jgi:hypothetical protein
MRTITVDIINNKALKLLEDLELLDLIKLHKQKFNPITTSDDWSLKYKGAMSKQPISEIENQLKEFRNEWE